MNRREFVMLRVDARTGALLGDRGLLGSTSGILADADWSIETGQMTGEEAADTLRDPTVLNCVEPMMGGAVSPAPDSEERDDNPTATWGLEAVGALSSLYDGAGIRMAILDTGINRDHEAFAGKNLIEADFTGEGNGDDNGHGTHCAGTAVGGRVNGKRIGVASGVTDVLVGKILGADRSGSVVALIEGLKWAAHQGAQVISLSYALDFPLHVQTLREQYQRSQLPKEWATKHALGLYRANVKLLDDVSLMISARSRHDRPCVIVAAAGNESLRNAGITVDAAPPSTSPGVLAVGAVGYNTPGAKNLRVCDFSNDCPTLVGPGKTVESAAFNDNAGLFVANGTSMATPHVAGVVALWMQELQESNPGYAYDELEASLFAHSRRDVFGAAYKHSHYGYGLVQAPQD